MAVVDSETRFVLVEKPSSPPSKPPFTTLQRWMAEKRLSTSSSFEDVSALLPLLADAGLLYVPPTSWFERPPTLTPATWRACRSCWTRNRVPVCRAVAAMANLTSNATMPWDDRLKLLRHLSAIAHAPGRITSVMKCRAKVVRMACREAPVDVLGIVIAEFAGPGWSSGIHGSPGRRHNGVAKDWRRRCAGVIKTKMWDTTAEKREARRIASLLLQ